MCPTIAHTQPQSLKEFGLLAERVQLQPGSLLQASQGVPGDLLSVPQLGRGTFVPYAGCSVLGCPASPVAAVLTLGLLAGAVQVSSTTAAKDIF